MNLLLPSGLRAPSFLVLGVALLAACDRTGPSTDFPHTADSSSTWFVGQAAGVIADFAVGFMNSYMPLPGPPAGADLRGFADASGIRLPPAAEFVTARLVGRAGPVAPSAVPEGCSLTARGGWIYPDVDSDQNGVPDDAYYREECLFTDSLSTPGSSSYVYTLVELHMTQRFEDLRGWDFSERVVQRMGNSSGLLNSSDERLHYVTSMGLHDGRMQFSHSTDYRQRYDTGGSTLASYSATVVFQQDARYHTDSTYTPSASLPSGDLTVTGRWYGTSSEGRNSDFRITTPTTIKVNGTCTAGHQFYPFDSGVIRSLLNGRAGEAQATTTLTGCGVAPTIVTEQTTGP